MAPLTGKRFIVLLVDGFGGTQLMLLRDCLAGQGALLLMASFTAGDILRSADAGLTVVSDYSFPLAAQESFDGMIVPDGITGEAIRENPAAMDIIEAIWERDGCVVTIGGGALALLGAGIAEHLLVAATPEVHGLLQAAGAQIADTPIAISENVFSARADADMQVLCQHILDFFHGELRRTA